MQGLAEELGTLSAKRGAGGFKLGPIIAGLIISIAIGFTLWAFTSSMTPYVDIATALRSTGPVQVRGKILHQTVRWDPQMKALTFILQDPHNQTIEVVYKGAKPESFDTAPETAVTGTVQHLSNGQTVFVSTSMVVKCPSKYDDTRKPLPYSKGGIS